MNKPRLHISEIEVGGKPIDIGSFANRLRKRILEHVDEPDFRSGKWEHEDDATNERSTVLSETDGVAITREVQDESERWLIITSDKNIYRVENSGHFTLIDSNSETTLAELSRVESILATWRQSYKPEDD